MPRFSQRQATIRRLDELLLAACKHGQRQRLLGMNTGPTEELVLQLSHLKQRVQSCRYMRRGRYRKKKPKFNLFLDTNHDETLTDVEFLHHFRVRRDVFWELVGLLKDNPCFKRRSTDSRGKQPKPAAHQLLVLLKYLGLEGNGSSSMSLGNFFGIGSGVVDDCRNNALDALLSLEECTYFWPSKEERKATAARIRDKYHWPHCVGLSLLMEHYCLCHSDRSFMGKITYRESAFMPW